MTTTPLLAKNSRKEAPANIKIKSSGQSLP
jgi:hypothetical protein